MPVLLVQVAHKVQLAQHAHVKPSVHQQASALQARAAIASVELHQLLPVRRRQFNQHLTTKPITTPQMDCNPGNMSSTGLLHQAGMEMPVFQVSTTH